MERSSSRRPRSKERRSLHPLPPLSDDRFTPFVDRSVTRVPSAAQRSRIIAEKNKIREKLENISAKPTPEEQNKALQEAAKYVLEKQKDPKKGQKIEEQLLKEQASNDNEYVRRDARALSYSMQDRNIKIKLGKFDEDIKTTLNSSGQDLADNMEYVGLKLQQDPGALFSPREFNNFVDFLIPKMDDLNPNVRQNARWLLDRLRVKANVRMTEKQLDKIKQTLINSISYEGNLAVINNTDLFLKALGIEESWKPIIPTAPHAAHPSPHPTTTTTTTRTVTADDKKMKEMEAINRGLFEKNEQLQEQLRKGAGDLLRIVVDAEAKEKENQRLANENEKLRDDLDKLKTTSEKLMFKLTQEREGKATEIEELKRELNDTKEKGVCHAFFWGDE
ncbi:hypothetical protein AYO37_00990 [Opitutia bacterium SCGC AG-212-L18]|nr:hypothetical protein AYO37_00990 [Opitutae bacterium SCGC AG-212-L18]